MFNGLFIRQLMKANYNKFLQRRKKKFKQSNL